VLTVTNEALVRRQLRKSGLFLGAAMAVFGVGFAVAWLRPEDALTSTISLVALGLGILLWQVSQYLVRRWGPRFRQDGALTRALKGLDNRYTLATFADSRLPDYLLVGPHGIRVLVTRATGGTVRCHRDQWSRAGRSPLLTLFLGNSVRNPTVEAVQGISHVQQFLQRELEPEDADAVPVNAIVVFTDAQVHLEVEACRFPVTRARDLRAQITRDKGPLGPPQIARLRRLLTPPAAAP